MENPFEQFLGQQQADFEKEAAPPPAIWKKLEQDLLAHYRQKKKRVIYLRRWSVAALVLIVAGWLLWPVKPTQSTQVVVTKPSQHIPASPDTPRAAPEDYAVSVEYYTRLTEAKQKEVRRLQSIQPRLYAEAKKTIAELDEMNKQLKAELPGSLNQEQVLQSMIQNLKIQEMILTKELELIKNSSTDKNDHVHEKYKAL